MVVTTASVEYAERRCSVCIAAKPPQDFHERRQGRGPTPSTTWCVSICRPSEQNIVKGSRKFEVRFCRRNNDCRGSGKFSRSWIRDEQGRSQALPSPVSLKSKLVKSLPCVQPVKKRKQLLVSPGPQTIEDVIEESEIPRLGSASDADHEFVELEQNLHPVPLTLEDDALERKRSRWDDVPLHMERNRRLTSRIGTRAVFVKHDAVGKLMVILPLHVDDGLLFLRRSDPIYWRVQERINTQFDMKDCRRSQRPQRCRLSGSGVWKLTPKGMQADKPSVWKC